MSKMSSPRKERLTCAISGRERPRRELVNLEMVRPSLAERIRASHPELAADALISRAELARYRSLYVEEMLKAESGDITELDRKVAQSLATHETLAEDTEQEYAETRTSANACRIGWRASAGAGCSSPASASRSRSGSSSI